LLSFLFVWQLSFSAPLSIASGCIGLAQYAAYLWPGLDHIYLARNLALSVPGFGPLEVHITVTPGTGVAMGVCLIAVFLLYRNINTIARLSTWLWAGVMLTLLWIIIAGLSHFSAARAFDFPAGAFTPSPHFFTGLGMAMLIATYDYWGYYNVCFLGGEVKNPERNIPRALLLSIVLVAALYLAMNISILSVVPWRELDQAAKANLHLHVASVFMQRIYGHWAGYAVTLLIIWTAFGSVFSLLLGYSRVLYAAAVDGNYFRIFARVDPRQFFPNVSLVVLGLVAMLFCLLRLADVIAALVVIRIVIQFLVQAVGLMVLRARYPERPRPFRMWLYPAPALLASAGFSFVLFSRSHFMRELRYATVIVVLGIVLYVVRAWRAGEQWPFGTARE
jgi:amino acid transporter